MSDGSRPSDGVAFAATQERRVPIWATFGWLAAPLTTLHSLQEGKPRATLGKGSAP